MKTGIHPKYENTTIKCACGNEIKTKSTVFPEIHTELCSACHPFFTGKQKFVDTAGRVDKFRARMEAKQEIQGKKEQKTAEKGSGPKSNQEKLAEIKNEITAEKVMPEKPMTVDQEMTSDEETAAAEELKEENQ